MLRVALTFLRVCMWLFWTGLFLWLGYWALVFIMRAFPIVAAVAAGMYAAVAVIAWRRSND